MKVRFFGVRGSTPTPGLSTVRYGGNTVCVEVRLADGTLLILDAGTGLRELGKVLMSEGYKSTLHLLLTHLHWDHIMGLPFFGPVWQKDTHLKIYPLANEEQQRAGRQRALFDGIHFPVRANDVPATIDFLENEPSIWRIGSATISRIGLNHPGGAQGFRIDDDGGASLAYLTDNELSPPGAQATSLDALAEFASDVNLLIHDAQYVESEMPAKRGWGHSTLEDVVRLGHKSESPHLVLFHHDPERDDDAVDAMVVRANEWLKERGSSTMATAACEGMVLDLPQRGTLDTVPPITAATVTGPPPPPPPSSDGS
jgi:phosphoribosyl 1,2-cyclic phosphodiesterase